jgi:hypothetical protein
MEQFTGGCLCGNVRFVASGLPYRVGVCHCLDCRKHHGSLFQAFAVFPQDAVTIEGETRDYAGRSFCPRCGSSAASPGCRRFHSRDDTTAIVTRRFASNSRSQWQAFVNRTGFASRARGFTQCLSWSWWSPLSS